MKQWIYLGPLLVLLSVLPATAANSASVEVRKVEVFPANGEVRVEVTLSSAVAASVETAQHPDRLILKLPGTVSEAQQKRTLVQQFGVRSIRYGLNRADQPETHLVVDLEQEHSYRLLTEGAKIVLIVEEPLSAAAKRRAGPAAAASKPLIRSLGRAPAAGGQPGSQSNQETVLLTPPPSGPAINFPAAATGPQATRASSSPSDQPTAAHPNRASLQEGTVFPNEGAPGAGIVPPVSSAPKPSGFDSRNGQNSAQAGVAAGTGTTQALQEPKVAMAPGSAAPPSSPEMATAAKGLGPDAIVAPNTSTLPVKEHRAGDVVPLPTAVEVAQSNAPADIQKKPEAAANKNPSVTGQKPIQAPGSAPETDEEKKTAGQDVLQSPVPSPEVAIKNTPADATSPAVATGPAGSAKPSAVAADTNERNGNPPAGENDAAASDQDVAKASNEAAEGVGQGRAPFIAHVGENSDFRTAFRVKYVAQDAAYLDGGRAAGLTEGMKLVIRDLPNSGAVAADGADANAAGDVAELEVLSVAESSAVTEIHVPKRPVKIGDLAYLSSSDQQLLVQKNALSATRKYPAVVSFTENDTLDDEARAEVPKPPLPSINRARGRIGFDYIGVIDHSGSGMRSTNLGMVMRADITRLNGTYWNVSGYWRGRFNSSSTAGTQTLQDLINRTYHLYTSYDNPTSAWVAGFGRMYLPWATSLDTIDGGYVGRKLKPGVTAGVFLGSTPDPTSYSYDPHRELGGGFVNFEGGSYDELHYTSTIGGGLNMLKWSVDRPFLFVENGVFYKRIFSVYQSAQIDNRQGYWYLDPTKNTNVWQPGTGWGPGRSFTTVRIQPHARVEFSFNHTYFRDMPTFDPTLIQTGLLDKFLFQGFSAGTRIEVHKQIWLSTDLGLSNRTGDKQKSLNEMFGITFGRLPWIGLRADARYTQFHSGFGSGSYEAISFSKNLGETLQLQFMAGQQNFASTLTSATRSRFLNGMVETALGSHYFLQAGGTISRGQTMSYDQMIFTFGYRFDNRHGNKGQ